MKLACLFGGMVVLLISGALACQGGTDSAGDPTPTPGSEEDFVLSLDNITLTFPDAYTECERVNQLEEVTQYGVCRSDPLEGQHVNFLVIAYAPGSEQPYDLQGGSPSDIAALIESDKVTLNPSSQVDVAVERVADRDGVQVIISDEDKDVVKMEYWHPLEDGGLLWLLSSASAAAVPPADHKVLFEQVRNSISPQ